TTCRRCCRHRQRRGACLFCGREGKTHPRAGGARVAHEEGPMSSAERLPFEIHGAGWYKEPLAYEVVVYEADPEAHVAKITMNRPERMNALSHQLRAELFHALKVAEQDTEINVIIVKGAGRCFSAGYDL